ncbi:MAG: PqqD family protein [Anaerolineales bacterium]|jgi:hypothetical protein
MEQSISLDSTYVVSETVVAREIEGEVVIVPLTAGVGTAEDALYSLNKTGQAIWSKLDGKRNLRAIAKELANVYEAQPGEIDQDILGLMQELLKRGIVEEV